MDKGKDLSKIVFIGPPRSACVQFELFNCQVFVAVVKGVSYV